MDVEREREREKLRTRNLEDRGNIVSKGLSCPRSFKLQYSLAGIAVSETTSKQTRMNLNDSFLQYAKSVLSIPRIEENFTPFLQEEEESSKTKKEKKILARKLYKLSIASYRRGDGETFVGETREKEARDVSGLRGTRGRRMFLARLGPEVLSKYFIWEDGTMDRSVASL